MFKYYKIRKLNRSEIIEAQKLLYRDYKFEQKWEIPLNPSNVRYENERLRDDFELIATWFGAFYKGQIVGCLRYIPARAGKLEVSRYIDFKIEDSAIELNRLSIDKKHRGGYVLDIITIKAYLHAIKHGYKVAYTTSPPPLAKIFINLGWNDTGVIFKYNPDDSETRCLIKIQGSKLNLVRYVINSILRKLKIKYRT
jgi:hypothetical protein